MKAVLIVLTCFLVFVLCESSERDEKSIQENSNNEVLQRSFREADRKSGKELKKKRKNKSKKENSRKGKDKKKAKKQKSKRRSSKGGKGKNKNQKRKTKKTKSKKGKKFGKRANSKRKNKKKNKKGKRKNKQAKNGRKKTKGTKRMNSKKKNGRQTTEVCNGTALGGTCLTNLVAALKYERDFVANFMNQKARAESFNKLIGKKGGKNDEFKNSTTYLLTALGGNVSNLTCGSNKDSSTSEAAIKTYKTLTNCSTNVAEACMIPNTTVNFTKLDTCKTYYEDVQKNNKKCFEMTNKAKANGTAVCECWKSAADTVATAKSKSPSCSANQAQSDLKVLKNTCLAAFGACKKAEDASVSFILKCSTDTGSSNSSVSSDSSSSTNSTGRAVLRF